MSTKEAFERAWFAQFSSGADGTAPLIPELSCWDSTGNLRSHEALQDELNRCSRRIAELRRNLRAEEFIEFYCQKELNLRSGIQSHNVAKRSASLGVGVSTAASKSSEKRVQVERIYSEPTDLESSEKRVQIEGLYSEPVDSTLWSNVDSNCESPTSAEGLYSEPVDAKGPHRMSPVPEPLYATPFPPKPVTAAKRVQRGVYEDISDVQAGKIDSGESNSSDDESVANLVAIRQSVSRLSQWCVDGDATRQKLAMQAKRLSSRFSHITPSTGCVVMNSGLDSVPECLFSPTTPSGMVFGYVLIKCTMVETADPQRKNS